MNIQDIIDNIAAGENSTAKESIENALSAKAFDALAAHKQQMAATLFGGQTQDENTNEEETTE